MTQIDEHSNRYRVFIVEDHPRVRRGLIELLAADPALAVVGEAASAGQALVRLKTTQSELVLVDFSMRGMNGIKLIERLSCSRPELRFLVLSSYHERYYVEMALAAGAQGYVLKSDPELLLRAIAEVRQGKTVVVLE